MSDAENQLRIESTPAAIAEYIRTRAKTQWAEKKQPLLLSNISPELLLRGVSYKAVLPEGTTLRQFVSSIDELRIVTHPTQRAKIGIVPKDSTFNFDVQPTVGSTASNEEKPKRQRHPNQRYIVSQFLSALSQLSEDELKQVVIPVHIIARLMEDK